MGDLYETLGLKRTAGPVDVKEGYRRMAPKYHPQTHPENVVFCAKRFAEVARAYEVLVDDRWRAAYDRDGEAGIRGMPHATPEVVFEEFFGTKNPHAVALVPGTAELTANPMVEPPKVLPPSIRKVRVSLAELFPGKPVIKKVEVTKGRTLDVVVPAGAVDGTQLTFKGAGETLGSDAIVMIEETREKGSPFRRNGDDLVHTERISLAQALLGCVVELTTLDGRDLKVAINEVVCPGFNKVVTGEGMPVRGSPSLRGNLVIDFEVAFPRSLSQRQRQLVRSALCEDDQDESAAVAAGAAAASASPPDQDRDPSARASAVQSRQSTVSRK